jgi:chemotaxis protein methyltransferase CheR
MTASSHQATLTSPEIKDRDFRRIKEFLYKTSGIHLSDAKRSLVISRLSSRLRVLALPSFEAYFDIAMNPKNASERTWMLDALTTNETYFFREPDHFVFLQKLLMDHKTKTSWRIWSGASSSGEEIYTIAMIMADAFGLKGDWLVTGTDLSTKVLKMATLGHYPLTRNEGIDIKHLKKYCLKGVVAQAGTFMIDPSLKEHCEFSQQNLMDSCDRLGMYDVIFLRNVMIYFDTESKQRVLNNVVRQLRVGGYFIISHAESMMNIQHSLTQVSPSIYKKD